MNPSFSRIILFGRPRSGDQDFEKTLNTVAKLLNEQSIPVYLEKKTNNYLKTKLHPIFDEKKVNSKSDLIIAIGGDGCLLSAARFAVEHDLSLLGINRGRLGFLTDILPNEMQEKILPILKGQYQIETRFLLEVFSSQDKNIYTALNDVVLLPGDRAHMLEFDVFINEHIMCRQRADGLIITTPTGSTAYALSGGGPILHPSLDAIALVPMFPHTLSSRPVVIKGDSQIRIVIVSQQENTPRISCDGRERLALVQGSELHIHKKEKQIKLLHPLDYSYFRTLTAKLHWEITY